MFHRTLLRVQPHFMYIVKRNKFYRKYWAPTKTKTTSTEFALKHFDEFYGSVFGEQQWQLTRKAILRNNKHIAVVNNFGDDAHAVKFLQNLGAHDLKKLFEAQKEFDKNSGRYSNPAPKQTITNIIENIANETVELDAKEKYDHNDTDKNSTDSKSEDVKNSASLGKSLSSNMKKAEIDETRIITAEVGLQAMNLWTFVPATRLKGCEDWIPESQHYRYYSCAKDFPLTIEEDEDLEFPEYLKVYAFERGGEGKFPFPKVGPTGVLDYYLMDGTSIMPVLALNLKKGDKVLDMCAAPGGKSLAILQTLYSSFLVSNDSTISRTNRILTVFREYLHDYDSSNVWHDRVAVTITDGRAFEDKDGFDKILIDVPCTTDRHSLKENDSNIFSSMRVKERLSIPELQSDLLSKALQLCRVGGTVVYSTCTLSPIQNDGVVHMGLKKAWENYGVAAVIKDMTRAFDPARSVFRIIRDQGTPKYGQLIAPDILSNYGPSYVAKLVKTK